MDLRGNLQDVGGRRVGGEGKGEDWEKEFEGEVEEWAGI